MPLPPSIQNVIEEWFCLVDTDGSGTVTTAELEATFKVRRASFRAAGRRQARDLH